MEKVLTIAGSDCSGGAGIQADLKTMCALSVYGMSVITALTAQNTTGVQGISEVSPEFVEAQIDSIFNDIVPDSVKIGMVQDENIIHAIVKKLKQYQVTSLVVDPVMVSTSNSRLLNKNATTTLINELLPLATVITPNLSEAEVLSGIQIHDENDMLEAAKIIANKIHTAVLIKGGHFQKANDLLFDKNTFTWYKSKRIDNPNTHGTGCTLSSAIACFLAKGNTLQESIRLAKEYLTGAIQDGLDLGNGRGPLNHLYLSTQNSHLQD